MNKPILRQMHGLITDYPYIALVSTAPETARFTAEKTATTLCRALAGGIFVSSLLTRAEWGFVAAIPFKAHLALDVANGLFAAAAPWLFGKQKGAKLFSDGGRIRHRGGTFFRAAGNE